MPLPMTSDHMRSAANLALDLMRDDPYDPYRQGYTFANALNAVAELHDMDRLQVCIVAEAVAKAIAYDPLSYSTFQPGPRGEQPMSNFRYLRLQIDIRVENSEFADLLLEGEADSDDLQKNIEAGEISIDGYQDVEDHTR